MPNNKLQPLIIGAAGEIDGDEDLELWPIAARRLSDAASAATASAPTAFDFFRFPRALTLDTYRINVT